MKTFIVDFPNCLHASCAVNVDYGRNFVSPFRADALGDQHERRVFIALENFVGPLGKNDWRKRPECLPMLDPHIQFIFHLSLARVRKDTAITESTRSKFRAALKPPKNMAF